MSLVHMILVGVTYEYGVMHHISFFYIIFNCLLYMKNLLVCFQNDYSKDLKPY